MRPTAARDCTSSSSASVWSDADNLDAMNLGIRIVATLVSTIGTFFFTVLIGGAWLSSDGEDWLPLMLAATAAAGAAGLVWTGTAIRGGFFSTVATAAVVTSGVGFCLGFFGPMLLAPQANQGPLLGIFITGPAGFVLGGVGGGLYWAFRRFSSRV